MLRASPFCLNAVYAVARQQALTLHSYIIQQPMRATRARTLAQSFGFALLRNGAARLKQWHGVPIELAHAPAFACTHIPARPLLSPFSLFPSLLRLTDPRATSPHRTAPRALLPAFLYIVCLVISSDRAIGKNISAKSTTRRSN